MNHIQIHNVHVCTTHIAPKKLHGRGEKKSSRAVNDFQISWKTYIRQFSHPINNNFSVVVVCMGEEIQAHKTRLLPSRFSNDLSEMGKVGFRVFRMKVPLGKIQHNLDGVKYKKIYSLRSAPWWGKISSQSFVLMSTYIIKIWDDVIL